MRTPFDKDKLATCGEELPGFPDSHDPSVEVLLRDDLLAHVVKAEGVLQYRYDHYSHVQENNWCPV